MSGGDHSVSHILQVKLAWVCYMKPIDGLPNPKGSLSSSIPYQVIVEANKEVQKEDAMAQHN